MRQGQQHRRGRGRNNNNNGGHSSGHSGHSNQGQRKGQNPLTRSFESNGPDVKVRGTPAHVAEKYQQLARDAQSSGDHVLAENYLQHAEHYNRIIFAYRDQQQQSGETMNGGGRPHMGRQSGMDSDDQASDDMGGHDEGGHNDQPMIVRNPMAEQPRGADMHPGQDDGRPQRQNDHHPRFRDRHQRHDRPERQDRPERPERQDSYDRAERGFDRNRERSFPERGAEQPGEAREPRDQREPREPREFREPREPREFREHRGPREPREPLEMREHREPREPREAREPRETREPRPIPRDPAPIDAPPPIVATEGLAPATRAEGGPRRRERFGLAPEHPDFLRRPVRRPRREPEPGFTAEVPPAPPPVDDSTRD